VPNHSVITIEKLKDSVWLVSVDAAQRTEHRVTVSDADIAQLAHGHSVEELLSASFEFLLEREPNTAILTSFELPLISRYFPEYEQEMQRRLGR
jgi:hypothetical protein